MTEQSRECKCTGTEEPKERVCDPGMGMMVQGLPEGVCVGGVGIGTIVIE